MKIVRVVMMVQVVEELFGLWWWFRLLKIYSGCEMVQVVKKVNLYCGDGVLVRWIELSGGVVVSLMWSRRWRVCEEFKSWRWWVCECSGNGNSEFARWVRECHGDSEVVRCLGHGDNEVVRYFGSWGWGCEVFRFIGEMVQRGRLWDGEVVSCEVVWWFRSWI